MAKTTTRVNFTTLRGERQGRKTSAGDYLEAKAERWINAKLEEGWNLRDVLAVDEHCVHVIMVKKEST